jgi:FMN phosphatase YigB (HAD superfamily)
VVDVQIKAVCFDLYGTLARVENPLSEAHISDFLVARGYEVYPQALAAAWHYVSFVDYLRIGYKSGRAELKQVLKRLGIKPDSRTLKDLAELYGRNVWRMFPDAEVAVNMAKDAGLRTAIVTTIARFKYREVLKPIWDKIDVAVDGYTFHCEKSNPRIYVKTLEALGVEAGEAVMIGDDLGLDILLPKRLGMKAILLDRTGQYSDKDYEKADAAVNGLREAMEAVKEIHAKP